MSFRRSEGANPHDDHFFAKKEYGNISPIRFLTSGFAMGKKSLQYQRVVGSRISPQNFVAFCFFFASAMPKLAMNP